MIKKGCTMAELTDAKIMSLVPRCLDIFASVSSLFRCSLIAVIPSKGNLGRTASKYKFVYWLINLSP